MNVKEPVTTNLRVGGKTFVFARSYLPTSSLFTLWTRNNYAETRQMNTLNGVNCINKLLVA